MSVAFGEHSNITNLLVGGFLYAAMVGGGAERVLGTILNYV